MAIHKFSGVTNFGGGEFDELVITGVITCTGDIKAKTISTDGVVTVQGTLEAEDTIVVGGVQNLHQSLRARDIRVDGVCTIEGAIEADHILCKGVINCKGQVSADLVEGRGVISAEEIVGEKVVIHCDTKKRKWFFRQNDLSKVKTIEATEIDVDGVRCENLNGETITIGPDCIIENVDCTGTLSIAPGAEVRHINGEAR